MKPQNSLALLALAVLAGAFVAFGCNKDVTAKPDSGVAANSQESSQSVSTIESGEPQTEAKAETETPDAPNDSPQKPSQDAPKEQPKPPVNGKDFNAPPAMGGGGQPGQGPGQGGPRGGMMRGWTAMLDQLNLTDAQKKKIETILEQSGKRMQELRQQQETQQGALREKFNQIRQETEKQIEAVLTAEQKAKLKQLREEMEQRMRERMRERGQGGPGGGGTGGQGGGSGTRSNQDQGGGA